MGYQPSLNGTNDQVIKGKIPPMEETFMSAGHIFDGQVTIIHEEAYNEVISSWIHQAKPGEELEGC